MPTGPCQLDGHAHPARTFLCPSDTPPLVSRHGDRAAQPPDRPRQQLLRLARLVARVGRLPGPLSGPAITNGPPNGLFNSGGAAIGLRDILDGSSNTVACGEWRMGSGLRASASPQVTIPTDVIMVGSYPAGVTPEHGDRLHAQRGPGQ